MKTGEFWVTVCQMADITTSSCRVATSQGQDTHHFERDQIRCLLKKCERQLLVLDEEVALNRGNGLKPSEKPCEEISHTTSEKQ
ncbi:hypothetical protein KW419_15995 [Vibrio fluvialis]|jgi:hypothetical protein|uniref:hypothetical protein n=1 Tax=Vibrio TaxID=662 RepID=UPI0005CABDE0|nr:MULTISPECIES: hypothetical protein [Vibrio]EKO3380839.1 hypothetical protein [Vibrio fluvialis]EKO3390378.1 hypothetical protein [Vibrio fluvialis]EKO3398611.1 hypothetical protein [Vibrio fluvialis]EKO3445337.1 hypothetical protein [Vibrio fluvialis]EKO3541601.1 hypothetical protein [Vibrio fluvialis]